MSDEQKRVYDDVKATTGRVGGPSLGYIYSPGLWESNNQVSDYIQDCGITQAQTRIAAIVTARFWEAQYPWAVQVQAALAAGVDRAVVDAVNDGRPPDLPDAGDQVVYDIATEILNTKKVSQTTYDKAVEVIGYQGLVDAVGVVGHFTLVGMVAITAEVDPPPDAPVALNV
jgi:4-carboxymuconolactone decarboxylase